MLADDCVKPTDGAGAVVVLDLDVDTLSTSLEIPSFSDANELFH
jgi:hypothetical protein